MATLGNRPITNNVQNNNVFGTSSVSGEYQGTTTNGWYWLCPCCHSYVAVGYSCSCQGYQSNTYTYPDSIGIPYPTTPTIPLSETDKMNLIVLLGELQSEGTLKQKLQETIDKFLAQKSIELNGEVLLLLMYSLLFTLSHLKIEKPAEGKVK